MSIEELAKKVEENSRRLDENAENINKNIENINKNFEQIQENTGAFDMLKIASEKLKNSRSNNKRLFVILIIVLVMWFATIGYLVYVLNDIGIVEETTQEISQENNNGDNNFIGNDGEINYGKAKD